MDAIFPYVFVFLPLAIFIFTVFFLFVIANAGTVDWYARNVPIPDVWRTFDVLRRFDIDQGRMLQNIFAIG